ncbi:MAG: hypothetical protein R2932_24570 [Caldilineaceae bacterium]
MLIVTAMRAAGLRVWVVGMSGKRIGGLYGLQLVADLALDEALPLADQAACVVVPCPIELLGRFLHDPRLRIFLETATVQETPLLMAQSAAMTHTADLLSEIGLYIVPELTIIYPAGEELLPFIRSFATKLSESLS